MLCFCFGERGAWRALFDFLLSRLAVIQHVGVRSAGWELKIFFRLARSVLPLLGSLAAELQLEFLPSPHTIEGGNAHVNLRISNDCETTQARRIYVEPAAESVPFPLVAPRLPIVSDLFFLE